MEKNDWSLLGSWRLKAEIRSDEICPIPLTRQRLKKKKRRTKDFKLSLLNLFSSFSRFKCVKDGGMWQTLSLASRPDRFYILGLHYFPRFVFFSLSFFLNTNWLWLVGYKTKGVSYLLFILTGRKRNLGRVRPGYFVTTHGSPTGHWVIHEFKNSDPVFDDG